MKSIVLEELRKNKNEYLSGEELSKKLNVSRTSVWKHINKLKKEGYTIDSSTNKGYMLIEAPSTLYPAEIKRLLDTKIIGKEIIFVESVNSTNNYGKKICEKDFIEGTLIITEEQTMGRGRLGRQWASPKGEGIWVSILLKPNMKPEQASQITLLAACAVAKSMRKMLEADALIKWPNDIVISGKKVCGILTEMGAEIDVINYLIIGIGINANMDEKFFIDNDLKTATSIKIEKGSAIDRKALLAEVISNFEVLYLNFLDSHSIEGLLGSYKEISATIGKEVRLIYNKCELMGTAVDINRLGQLVVKLTDGKTISLNSGEVSVRGIYGYI